MKTTTTNLFLLFKRIAPEATIISSDYEFWCPSEKELKEALKASPINLKQYAGSAGDCDKFALVLHAQIILLRWGLVLAGVADNELPWAFGQVRGTQFRGKPSGRHAINFCMTTSGLRFIEPQSDEIWLPVDDKIDLVIY